MKCFKVVDLLWILQKTNLGAAQICGFGLFWFVRVLFFAVFRLKQFCIKEMRINAFLGDIQPY